MPTIQEELARVYAGRELNRLELLRACGSARRKGLKQAEVRAALPFPSLKFTDPAESDFPELLEVTPREVILKFHAGRIGHEQMLEELKAWNCTIRRREPENPEGRFTGGSLDDIPDAFHRD